MDIIKPLSPILPSGHAESMTPPSGIVRAQDLSILKLQQKRDVEAAGVSMSQIMMRRRGISNGPTTSVSHIGQTTTQATTSVSHPATTPEADHDAEYNEGANRRRYTYMRKMIKERQAREAIKAGPKKDFAFKTGAQFVGRKLHKSLVKMVKLHPEKYNSLSPQDRQFFENMVARYAKMKVTGTDITRLNRLSMRHEIEMAKRSGQIKFENAKTFRRLIEDL